MKRALLLSILSLMVAGVAFAGTQDGAVVALHDQSHGKAVNVCSDGSIPADPTSNGIDCFSYSTDNAPTGINRDVYLVVALADPAFGIAGLSCGISYNPAAVAGVDVFAWILCSDLEFPNAGPNGSWPASGGGNRITWAAGPNCQNADLNGEGVHAVAGAFYIYAYSDDQMCVTGNLNLVVPEFKVADCNASESDVLFGGGCVGYGQAGYNPCDDTPVERTSWGAIKGNLK